MVKKSTDKTDIKKKVVKKEIVKKDANSSLDNPKINIQNIVVSADLHATIDLYSLSREVRAVDYEPEQFPGAIFRVPESKAIILFKNGKMICTGSKTEKEVKTILEYVSGVVSKYVVSMNKS
jgi:transcription initiation factor TFIID TATA-box-binding protein